MLLATNLSCCLVCASSCLIFGFSTADNMFFANASASLGTDDSTCKLTALFKIAWGNPADIP